MNRFTIDLTVDAPAESGLYTYDVSIYKSSWVLVYNGKAYVLAGQTELHLDLTDILSNYAYRGAGALEPVWDSTVQRYQQPTQAITKLYTVDQQDYANVRVRLYGGSGLVDTATAYCYFHSIPFNKSRSFAYGQTTKYALYQNGNTLIPHMPAGATLRFAQLMVPQNTVENWYSDASGTTVVVPFNDLTTGRSTVLSASLSALGDATVVYGNDGTYKPILYLDTCPKPYYLLWIDDSGALQSQGFLSSSEYSEQTTYFDRTTHDDYTFISSILSVSQWKLKSPNLTDSAYAQYSSLGRSPYVALYNTGEDRLDYVRVTDTTYTERTLRSNNGRPVYFEVNVQTSESLG